MTDIVDLMGQLLGEVLAHPAVGFALRLLVVGVLVLWIASAWWVWRDARARTRDPLVPYLAAGAVVVASPVLFWAAAVVYRVVRPPLTVAASEAAALQLAVLEEVAGRRACVRCDQPVEDAWIACPACGSRLAVRCAACNRPLELDWRICAWCAAEVPWADEDARVARPTPVAIPIRPGGRPLVPVMALPEDDAEPAGASSARRPAPARRRRDGSTG